MVQLWRAFDDVVPLFLIIVLVTGVIFYFVYRKRNVHFKKNVINILLVLSLIAILLVTVYPQSIYSSEMPRIINLIPLIGMYEIMFHSVDITVPIRNLGFNILLFVPFGFFLSLSKFFQKKLMLKVILTGFFLSLFIEFVQYFIPMGRSADVDDLILNTVGAYIGYIVWKVLNVKSSNIFTLKTKKTSTEYQ